MHYLTMAAVVSSLSALPGCGPPELDRARISAALIQDRGVLAGHDLGDSWADIKARHDPMYTVHDDAVKQLRADEASLAQNGHYLTFEVAGDKVTGIEAEVNGQKQNALIIPMLVSDVTAHFGKRMGPGRCMQHATGGETCTWRDAKYHASLMHSSVEADPPRASMKVTVEAAPQ